MGDALGVSSPQYGYLGGLPVPSLSEDKSHLALVCRRGRVPGAREHGASLSPLGVERWVSRPRKVGSPGESPGELPRVLTPVSTLRLCCDQPEVWLVGIFFKDSPCCPRRFYCADEFGNHCPGRSGEKPPEAQDCAALGGSLIVEASPGTSSGCWAQAARAERERQGHCLATCLVGSGTRTTQAQA